MCKKILVIGNYNSVLSSRPEAEIFIGLKKMGYDITVITKGNSFYANKFRENQITVIDYYPSKKYSKDAILKIKSELELNNYDILHLFTSKSIRNGIEAAKDSKVKVILYRGYSSNINWYDPTSYFKYFHPRVDKIICNSIGVEELFRKQLFFDKKKLVTINKGHDLDWYKSITPKNLQELKIPKEAFVVTCVANVRRMKGIKYLLEATTKISSSLPIHFIFIGEGYEKLMMTNLVKKNPNKERLHFLGYRDDSINIVAASNVFVLSSIKGESITKAVIEAMALEVTPLITDIAGNKELVIHNQTGWVVPKKNSQKIAEGICYLFEHSEECKKMGKESKKRVGIVLNIQKTIEEYKKLYNDLLKK